MDQGHGVRHEDETIQAHRGSFKTTCLHISFAFILVLFPGERVIFLRKTDDDVAEVMTATANVLQSEWFQALGRMLYGTDLVITKATQSSVSTNLKQGVSGAPQLLGLGCGGSLTGKHADKVFTDDIVNVKDRVSAAERERIKLLYMELQNIRNRGGRIFNTGTPWHKDDAFQLMPNIRRWSCFETGLMSREDIERVRASMSPSLFAANYELKHIADEDAMFTNAQFFKEPQLLADGIGHIDASYRRRRLHGVHLRQGEGRRVVRAHPHVAQARGRLPRRDPEGVQGPAHQHRLLRVERRQGLPAQVHHPQGAPVLLLPGGGEQVHQDKHAPAQPVGQHGNIDCDQYPLDADALNQVLDYSENAAHDDMPDSLASAIRQWQSKPGVKFFKGGI